MKPLELIEYINHYIKEYPAMEDNNIIFHTSHTRRHKEGFYHRQEFRGIGMNALIGKDNLTITLDK